MQILSLTKLSMLIILALTLSCSRVQEQDLYGTYFAQYEFGSEKLVLHPNGEYEQNIKITLTSETFQKLGKWKYNPKYNDIELEDAYSVQDGFGHLDKSYNIPSEGRVLLGVDRWFPWSGIKLGSDELVQLEKLPAEVAR